MDVLKYFQIGVLLGFFCSNVFSQTMEIRDFFQCENCMARTCPLIANPCELVREPGICSCCLVCARKEGEFCGLTLGRCGRGLSCRPVPGDPDPIMALMIGRAKCRRTLPDSALLYASV